VSHGRAQVHNELHNAVASERDGEPTLAGGLPFSHSRMGRTILRRIDGRGRLFHVAVDFEPFA